MLVHLLQQQILTNSALQTHLPGPDAHIFICTDAGWKGQCTNLGFWANDCQNFPSNFQNRISSIGADAGWTCTVYL